MLRMIREAASEEMVNVVLIVDCKLIIGVSYVYRTRQAWTCIEGKRGRIIDLRCQKTLQVFPAVINVLVIIIGLFLLVIFMVDMAMGTLLSRGRAVELRKLYELIHVHE